MAYKTVWTRIKNILDPENYADPTGSVILRFTGEQEIYFHLTPQPGGGAYMTKCNGGYGMKMCALKMVKIVFLYFSIYVFALPRYLWRVATRNVKICCRPALQNVQCFCVWEGVSGRGLFFTVHSAFSIQCTRFYFMQYIHAILIRICRLDGKY